MNKRITTSAVSIAVATAGLVGLGLAGPAGAASKMTHKAKAATMVHKKKAAHKMTTKMTTKIAAHK